MLQINLAVLPQSGPAAGSQDALFDALDQPANVEVKRGNLNAAADYLDRVFAVKDKVQDKTLAMYGYIDCAGVYYDRASKCDYETNFSVCDDAFRLAVDDYQQAFNSAESGRWQLPAREIADFLRLQRHCVGIAENKTQSGWRTPVRGSESCHR